MPYNGGIGKHQRALKTRYQRLFLGVVTELGNSVRFGSALTGAKGQPVATGNLLLSWIDEITAPFQWKMSTNVSYAPDVERNTRGVTFRNHGPHSVATTVAAFDRVVAKVAAEVGA